MKQALLALCLLLLLSGCTSPEPATEPVVWLPTGTLAPETVPPAPTEPDEPEPPAYELDSYEYAMFPMDYLQITQTSHEGSHLCNWAIDLGGQDRGIDDFYAPFTLRIVRIQEGYNIVWGQSVEKVHLANGGLDYVTVLLEHDDSIEGLYVGQVVQQGEVFYQEGMAGNATGNHVHVEFGLGPYVDEGSFHAEDGRVACNNGIAANEILFLTQSTQMIDQEDGGFTWKTLPIPNETLLETGYRCQGEGHLPQAPIPQLDAACTTGVPYSYTCQLCGQSYTSQLPPTGHAPEEVRRIDPTDSACGAAFYRCKTCGESWLELLWRGDPACPFQDVAERDAPYVATACQKGYLTGFQDSETQFLPDGFVTRRELITTLYQFYGQAGYTCDFSDVWDDDEDYDAIAWASQLGLAGNTEGERFAPDAAVTREDALQMVRGLMQLRGLTTPAAPDEDNGAWAVAIGLTPASANLHCPLTRAECARLLTMMDFLPDVK